MASTILITLCVALAIGCVWFGVWDGYRADATGTSGQGATELIGTALVLTTLVAAVWFRVRSHHV